MFKHILLSYHARLPLQGTICQPFPPEAMLQVNVHALVSHLITVAFGKFKLNAPYMHMFDALLRSWHIKETLHPTSLGFLVTHFACYPPSIRPVTLEDRVLSVMSALYTQLIGTLGKSQV